jgi:hypothetical protein
MTTETQQSFYTPSTSTHLSHGPAVDEFLIQYSSTINSSTPFHTLKDQRRGPLGRVVDRVRLEYYRYEVTFGLYVMTPSDKCVVNTFVVVVLTLLLWALLLYFPSLLYQKLSRLVWLLTGHSGGEVGAVLRIPDKHGNPITPASFAENVMASRGLR